MPLILADDPILEIQEKSPDRVAKKVPSGRWLKFLAANLRHFENI
jgi:hypothetical protein